MRLFKAWAIAIAATVICGAAAQADLVITGVTRSVTSTVTGPMGGSVGSGHSSMALGHYDHAVMIDSTGIAGTLHADASQFSDTPDAIGPFLGGAGIVSGAATPASGMTGFSTTGDSFFDVFFTVTLDGPYLFDADVEWTGDVPPFGGFAVVLLEVSVGPPAPPISISKGSGSPGAASLTTIVPLFTGTTYHLLARAKVDGAGAMFAIADAGASFGFTLSAVPESGAWLLTAPLALGLALAAWRRRAHPPLVA